MSGKYSLDRKKAAVVAFGAIVAVLGATSRFFVKNSALSMVVVVLTVVFFVALIWVWISSRRAALKEAPKPAKRVKSKRSNRKAK